MRPWGMFAFVVGGGALVLGPACGRAPSAPPEGSPASVTTGGSAAPATASSASGPASASLPAAPDTAAGARLVAAIDQAVAACPPEAGCGERTAWRAAAAGHEIEVLSILERPGVSAADEDARALAASVLFDAEQRHALPDAVGPRVLAAARARRPPRTAGLDVLLARVVVGMDAERLGLAGELRDLVSRWPATPFQTTLVEELRTAFPASLARVDILAGLVGRGPEPLERSAVEGLAARPTSGAACAALGRGLASPSPTNAVYAALRIVSAPCGAERERALDEIARRERRGQLPGIPWPHRGVLSYLCPFELPEEQQERPLAVLAAIALSRRQPLPIRREAMSSLRVCSGARWRALRPQLAADPDRTVRDAASGVDGIIIDL